MERTILRGDIYYADLNPIIGSEQGGIRPVLVIQNDVGNKHSPTVIVAAITSRAKTQLPTHISLSGISSLEKDSIVLLEQIRTIDKRRLRGYIGTLSGSHMNEVNHALTISVGLNGSFSEPLVMSLCHSCVKQFYDSPGHTVKQANPNQREKETCMFCNVRQGYDFEIRRKGH